MTLPGSREASIDHSATELLEVERLTTALSADWLEQHAVLPLRLEGDVLTVGTWIDRVDALALDDLRLLFGAGIALERFAEHDLRTTIRRLYAPEAATAEGLIAGLTGEARAVDIDEIPLAMQISSGAILVRADGTAPVYLVDQGTKRWITSPAIMDKYNFAWGRVYVLPPASVYPIPVGPNIDS